MRICVSAFPRGMRGYTRAYTNTGINLNLCSSTEERWVDVRTMRKVNDSYNLIIVYSELPVQ